MTNKQWIHDRVAATILKLMDSNLGDPVMAWSRSTASALHISKSATADSVSRGINILLLWFAADVNRVPTGLWASCTQRVRCYRRTGVKGREATQDLFYKFGVDPPAANAGSERRLARMSSAFNTAQVAAADYAMAARAITVISPAVATFISAIGLTFNATRPQPATPQSTSP